MSDYHVERHIFKPTHPDYSELDELCFLSKNLYNATLYTVRQYYFQTGNCLDYNTVNKQFTHSNQSDYRALPAKVSKHTQMLVSQNFKSFFGLMENKLPANIPRYLHKEKGRQVVHYEKGALDSFLRKLKLASCRDNAVTNLSLVKHGWVKLSKTKIRFKTKIEKDRVQFVRVVPCGSHIVIEVGYKVQYPKNKPKRQRYGSIDIGLNNLATVTSNVCKPIIFNGKPLKSINQFFNKEIAKERSKLAKKEKQSNKRFNRLFLKRKNKIAHYIHQVSKQIVNHLVSNDIDTLVIGNNKKWKQDINLGNRNNQNFVSIPFATLINQLKYKCKLVGIDVVTNEESYTSKCSFLDNEEIKKHQTYLGKRIKRGLFQTNNGKVINADVNGSLNILKKYLIKQEAWNEKLFSDLVEVSSTPFVKKFTPSF